MAQKFITIGSRFNPFSYAEILQPLQMATEAHREIEDQYAELATKANVWEGMANAQNDPYAYNMYKKYSDDLERQAETLAREGLNPASRQNMLKMRQRYSSEITPIEQAYARRKELVDEQRKLLAQDNTMMFDKDASMLSLDDLIRNPQLSYRSHSGNEITRQAGTAFANLAKEMRTDPRRWSSILNGQYFQTKMQEGYDVDEILLASINDPRAPLELRYIIENAVQNSNIADWNNKEALNRAYEYARMGAWNAIGKTQYQQLADRGYEMRNRPISSDTPEDPEVLFMPRIIEGAQGNVNKDLKMFEGFRPADNELGYSTTKLDLLKSELDKAKKIFEEKISKIDLKAANNYIPVGGSSDRSSYAEIGKAMSASTSKNYSEYLKYQRAKKEYDSYVKKYEEEVNKIKNYISRYSHLKGSDYDKINIGMTLENLQQKQDYSSFVFNAKSSKYNDIRNGIKNILSTFTEDSIDAGTLGLVDSDGDILSYKDLENLLEEINKVGIKVKGGNNPAFTMTYKGKDYGLLGIEQIDNYNKQLKDVDNYLKDFSNSISKNAVSVSQGQYENILNGNTDIKNIKGIKITSVPGTSYNSAVIYNEESGDYMKILLDKSNKVVAYNTLSDELSGGKLRDSYFIKAATSGLNSLDELFAYGN